MDKATNINPSTVKPALLSLIIYKAGLTSDSHHGDGDHVNHLQPSLNSAGPDSRHFTIAITACGKQRRWQPALHLLHRSAGSADVISYNATISALEMLGKAEGELSAIDKERQRSQEKNNRYYSWMVLLGS